MQQLFSVSEVSRVCQLSSRDVLNWIQKGKLKAAKNLDGDYTVKREDLVRLLQNMRLCIPDELTTESPFKILIVDDEPCIRRLLRLNLLGRFPGIAIEESGEGFHAGWRAHDFVPDVIILDILMPGMDGFRLCRLIRNHEDLSETKIIAVSALRENETRTRILGLGADEFIAKPFRMEALEDAIVRLLSCKDLHLDMAS